VKDGINGFIVPPKNSAALYNAMKKIISSESLTKDMGEKSLKIVKSYTYERMALGFLRAILYAFDVKEGREPKGAIRNC
jgi:glycosyltransferase involved in cell wall biosynthesis